MKSVKAQMRKANKLGAKWVVITGASECNDDEVLLRNMQTGEQRKIKRTQIIKETK